jgi:choline transporter-like protein 2/4/5
VNGKTYVAVNPKNQESATSLISIKIINTDKLISWISDLAVAWPIILASIGFSFIIILIYMLLVRCFAEFIAYLTIILIIAALAGLGYVFQARAEYYNSVKDNTYELTMKVLCGLCYSLAGIWLLVVLFLCNRIRLAIALIKTVAEYLKQTCTVFLVPFIFYVVSGCFYAYWVALSVYLYSSGEIEKSNGSFLPDVKWTSTTRYAWWYHLFALFYINAFLNAYNTFVLASSACIWYWKPSKDTREFPVYKSFFRAGRYHLGSIAFGSLIVAVIRFMIAILEYIKQKIDATKVGEKAGKFYKCLISCCQCCLNCCARCIEHINKHAYIQVI